MGIWQGKGRHPDGPSVGASGGAEKGGIGGPKRQGHEGAGGQGRQGSPRHPWWGAGVHGRAGGRGWGAVGAYIGYMRPTGRATASSRHRVVSRAKCDLRLANACGRAAHVPGHPPPCVGAPVAQVARIFRAKMAAFASLSGKAPDPPPPSVRCCVYRAVRCHSSTERRSIDPLAPTEHHRPVLGRFSAYYTACGKCQFLGRKSAYPENR